MPLPSLAGLSFCPWLEHHQNRPPDLKSPPPRPLLDADSSGGPPASLSNFRPRSCPTQHFLVCLSLVIEPRRTVGSPTGHALGALQMYQWLPGPGGYRVRVAPACQGQEGASFLKTHPGPGPGSDLDASPALELVGGAAAGCVGGPPCRVMGWSALRPVIPWGCCIAPASLGGPQNRLHGVCVPCGVLQSQRV